jgi:hypothetical protein
VLKSHDIHSNEMLSSLRLGVGLITSDKEEGSVHDGGTSEHSSHKGIVTWAINEGNMTGQDEWRTAFDTLNCVRLCAIEGLEAVGGVASGALVELGVGVTKLDSDVTELLSEEADRLKAEKRAS